MWEFEMSKSAKKTWFLGTIFPFVPIFLLAGACNASKNQESKTSILKENAQKTANINSQDEARLQKNAQDKKQDSANSSPFLENQKNDLELRRIELIEKEKKQEESLEKIEAEARKIKQKETKIVGKIEKIEANVSEAKQKKQEEKAQLEKEKAQLEKAQLEKARIELEKQQLEQKAKLEKEKQELSLKVNKQILVEKKELDEIFRKIPDFLEISQSEKNRSYNSIDTLLWKLREKPSTFHYTNFIQKLKNFDDEHYDLSFKFPFEVKVEKSSSDINEHRLENVELFLAKKGTSLKLTKKVTLFWNLNNLAKLEKTEAELYKKELLPVFSKISPSILAYALVNSDKESFFDSPLFADFSAAFNQISLSVGLKGEFLGIKLAQNPEKWSFDIVSASPNDETGELKLRVQKTKTEDTKQNIGAVQEFSFTGFKKNNDEDFEFEVDPNLVWPQIRDKNIFKDNQHEQNLSEVQKGQIGKILLDNLFFKLKDKNDPDIILKDFQISKHIKNNSNFFAYPQVISLKWSETNQEANKKIKMEIKDKKLQYSFNLEFAYLAPNSTLNPNDQSLQFASFKTKLIKGEIPLEYFLK
ncbi:hypothetical protein DR095_00600 [Mycoplasma flocculare]|nr:hypothetical protein [Mesomycoplasma flocculare]